MIVSNITKKNLICHKCLVADTFWRRFKGLLGQRELATEEGLLIIPCRSVHTFGMRFPIDVVFIAEDGRVVALLHELVPYKISRYYSDAVMVLELPAKRIADMGIEIGDLIIIDK